MTAPVSRYRYAGLPRELFDEESVSAQTKQFNARLEQASLAAPARWEMDIAYERSLSPGAGAVPVLSSGTRAAEVFDLPGPAGSVSVRVIEPSTTPVGIYVHLHPGGFSLGQASNHDAMLAETSDAAGVVTVSVDYRLAPEHPYPAAPADVEAVVMWLLNNGLSRFGCDRIVIGGESAGAVLTATTALRLRDRHGYTGLGGVNLSMGAYDLRVTPGLRHWGERRLILNTPIADLHFARYLGGRTDRDNPDISPLFARLHDLPPALFTVGTLDPLLEDNLMMHQRWTLAGNTGWLDVYPGGVHGFTLFDTDQGREGRAAINSFVRDAVTDKLDRGAS